MCVFSLKKILYFRASCRQTKFNVKMSNENFYHNCEIEILFHRVKGSGVLVWDYWSYGEHLERLAVKQYMVICGIKDW